MSTFSGSVTKVSTVMVNYMPLTVIEVSIYNLDFKNCGIAPEDLISKAAVLTVQNPINIGEKHEQSI